MGWWQVGFDLIPVPPPPHNRVPFFREHTFLEQYCKKNHNYLQQFFGAQHQDGKQHYCCPSHHWLILDKVEMIINLRSVEWGLNFSLVISKKGLICLILFLELLLLIFICFLTCSVFISYLGLLLPAATQQKTLINAWCWDRCTIFDAAGQRMYIERYYVCLENEIAWGRRRYLL